MGAGEGGGGGGHQDIEEKFKKEISKEMANLKEFLIQQVCKKNQTGRVLHAEAGGGVIRNVKKSDSHSAD